MPKLLLVEDEKILRDAFTIVLQSHSYDVDTASNGQEAIELCERSRYDLILLDLMMPVLDGVGFLERARPQKNFPHTRVVVLSNLSSGGEITLALELGAHRQEVKSNLSPKDVIGIVKEELALV